jgi:hypothetical protein
LEDFYKQDYYTERYEPFLQEYTTKAPFQPQQQGENQKQHSLFSLQNQAQQPEIPGLNAVQKTTELYGNSVQEQYQEQLAQQQMQQQLLQQQQEQLYLQQYWQQMIQSLQTMTPEQYQQYVGSLTQEQQQYLYYYQSYFQQLQLQQQQQQ